LRAESVDSTLRSVARLAASAGVIVAGVVAALVLHASYGPPTLPSWRDPLALVLAFGAAAAAVLLIGRPRRVGLAVGVVGSAFAGAVYVHQQAVHAFSCPPGAMCVLLPASPGLWSYPASLSIIAAGLATAVLLVLPRRWLAPDRLRLRHR
jgi:hypothetical protein